MPRKIGWEKTDITAGRGGGGDRERQFRGVKGTTFVVRVLTDCDEFRKHFVDDVLDPDEKTGEARGFNMLCAKTWDDDEDDYAGDCEGCERDYDLNIAYIAGILVVGERKGRSKRVQKIDPENAPRWWDFGPDKYRLISDIALDLQRGKSPKKLSQVELTVKCEDDHYQKLTIQVSQDDPIMTKKNMRDYIDAWKEEGKKLLEDATKSPDVAEQKRRLKKKKGKRPAQRDDEDEDQDEDPPKKRRARKAKKDEEPEDAEDEDGETEDDELDDLLDGL